VKALADPGRRIVVLIDDIDRLLASEIRTIFRLVKAVGAFPNTVYVLAFDNDVVAKSLQNANTGDGYSYLEKMVQLSIDVPLPDRLDITDMVTTELDKLVRVTSSDLFAVREWRRLYFDMIQHLLETPRDVNRYVNYCISTYPPLIGEVNLVDHLGLQALRAFATACYGELERNQDLLIPTERPWYTTVTQNSTVPIDEVQRWLTPIKPAKRSHIENLLKFLFPQMPSQNNSSRIVRHDEVMRRQRRISSSSHFSSYFRLSLNPDELSFEEMQATLDSINSGRDVTPFLNELLQSRTRRGRSKLELILDRLEDHTSDSIHRDSENITLFLTALFNTYDNATSKISGAEPLELDIPMRMLRISYQLLQRFDTQSDRYFIIRDVLQKTNSVSMVVHYVVVEGQEHGKRSTNSEKPEQFRTIGSHHLSDLELIAIDKIRHAVESDDLALERRLGSILFAWQYWGYESEAREYVRNLILGDQGFVRLVVGFSGSQFSSDEDEVGGWREERRIDESALSKFVPIAEARARSTTFSS
jgi:predicted KAP-like P-loop ATPase